MLSQAVEDYIKTIYRVRQRGETGIHQRYCPGPERVRRLGHQHGQTAGADGPDGIRTLPGRAPDGHRQQSGAGNHPPPSVAGIVSPKRDWAIPWDKVHEEAERLEHHISEEFEQKIDEMLGHPTHDPHGDPIPTWEGEIAEHNTNPLAAAEARNCMWSIERVSDEDPALLNHLESLGLLPGATLEIVGERAFRGAPEDPRRGTGAHARIPASPTTSFVDVSTEKA